MLGGRVAGVLALLLLLGTPLAARAGVASGQCVMRGRPGEGLSAVVWVDSLPVRVERRLAEGRRGWFQRRRSVPKLTEVRLQKTSFRPQLSALALGTGLIVRNTDNVWHGVFSVTPGREFELGKRAPGRVDTLRFSRPGPLSLRCDIHPDESGWVVVTPNHAFARTDRNGRWTLPELPAGRYRLRAWWPDGRTQLREVVIPAKGVVNVRLERSPGPGPAL